MDPTHFTIRILDACPDLGLHPGDLVTLEPEIESPEYSVYVHRPLPATAGALLPMLTIGAAELISPHSTIADLAIAADQPAVEPTAADLLRTSNPQGLARLRRAVKAIRRRRRGNGDG